MLVTFLLLVFVIVFLLLVFVIGFVIVGALDVPRMACRWFAFLICHLLFIGHFRIGHLSLFYWPGVYAEVAKLRSFVDETIAANGGIGTTCDA